MSRGLTLPLFLSTKKVPFPAIKTKKGTNIIRVTTLIPQKICGSSHTSICYPYNGGYRRGLLTCITLSARFLERISLSGYYLLTPPTGSLKIISNMTLFSSTNLVNNIFFTWIIIVLSRNKSSENFYSSLC